MVLKIDPSRASSGALTQVLVDSASDGGESTVFEVSAKVVDVVDLTVDISEGGPVVQLDTK